MRPGRKKQVILKFIDAITAKDSDRVQSFFSDKSIVHGDSGDIYVGREAIWDAISKMHGQAEQVDWQIDKLNETEQGRVEAAGKIRFLISKQWKEFELNGSFEVNGSKITQWQ